MSIGGDFVVYVGGFGQCGWSVRCHGTVSLSTKRRFYVEQIIDAPSNVDVRSLVVSAREKALMKRRRWNFVVNREPSFFISWTGERLDPPARGLLSRVIGITSRSRTVFQPAEVSLERETALPVSSQCAPPSARVSNIDGFSWVIGEPVRDMLGRKFLSLRMMSFWVTWGVQSRADGSRVRISQVADEELVFLREGRFHAYEAFSRNERNASARSHQ